MLSSPLGISLVKFRVFYELFTGTVVFSNTVGRLHVLHLLIIYFTCLVMWLGRHLHLFTVCYVSGTRLAIEGKLLCAARHPTGDRSDARRSGRTCAQVWFRFGVPVDASHGG